MKIKIDKQIPKKGEKLDFSIFDTDVVFKVYDIDPIKVRSKISNIAVKARKYGYDVRSFMVKTAKGYVGGVTKRTRDK